MKPRMMLLSAGWFLLAGGAGCTDRSADRTQELPPPVQNTPSGAAPDNTPGRTGTQGGGGSAAPTQPPGPEGGQGQQQQPTGTKK